MQKRSQEIDPEIHAETVAEIARLAGEFNRRRRDVTNELAKIFASRGAGGSIEAVPPPSVTAAREMAATMLNGRAPIELKRPAGVTREGELLVERDAIDICIKILQRDELAARAAEAAQWIEQHGDEWRRLCRETILAAIKFRALEWKAKRMRDELRLIAAMSVPMGEFIGTFNGSMIEGLNWHQDPLYRPLEAAVAEKIISQRDIEIAEKDTK